jgi:hypothetical protein
VRVVAHDLASGRETVLASDPRVDAGDVLVDPLRHEAQVVDFPAARRAWKVLDPSVERNLEALRAVAPGDLCLGGRVEPLGAERIPGSTAVVREVGRSP